ncbi:unnamed protein product [Euphydryas editha]|uniref:RNA-directed DNA polymerase n=1 Tax=Euphydryas editha TaxID=104508 RepID=A0AAU9TAN6_EUPED|nr:unnamed protein product [Euphydryas editha]
MSLDNENVDSPISEVRCNLNDPHCESRAPNNKHCEIETNVTENNAIDEKWRLLMEQQNRNFLALIQAMRAPNSSSDLRLPDFDPAKNDVDARAWITTADMCVTDQHQGASLMIALSRSLKGEASTWLSTVSFPGMTWSDFKELFVTRYDCPETPASFLIHLHNRRPKDNECLAAYAATLMSSLMSRWSGLTTEQIAIATTLSHISKFEPRVQKLAFTSDIRTRNQMQKELKAVSFLKRNAPNNNKDSEDLEVKRARSNGPGSIPKCFICGKLGHRSTFCRMKRGMKPQEEYLHSKPAHSKQSGKPAGKSNHITCFHCSEQGHYASSCPKRNKTSSSTTVDSGREKRVDVCVLNAPTGSLRHSGELFSFSFDSGAECSLIKESVACKFSGKRFYDNVTMTGIGQTSINSTMQIFTTVEVNDMTFEILLHSLPNYCLRHDIMIGREVLLLGIAVHIYSNQLIFEKVKVVDSCDVIANTDIDFNLIDTDVPPEFKPQLFDILETFRQYFTTGVPTSSAKTEPMKIRLVDPHKTINRRPYRLSPDERQVVRNKIDELLRANIIRRSSSPFASPILLVKKKDGTDRMCVDYRELNDNTVPDRFPLPLISDQIARLHGGHFFSILDLASGFHQIPIEPDSIEKTAFVTPDGQYEFLKMPFGLRNAPSVFQRVLIHALGDLVNSYVVVYMDDVLIIASNAKEALERLQVVLNILAQKGFSLNPKKCAFLKQEVEYLGFVVSKGQIRPNPRKKSALSSLPPPETITQLRQFIGLASYFRQFVPKFSQILAPLYSLTSGNGKIKWKPDHEAIRQKIISVLTSEPVLMIFDPALKTELHTDASAIGYGAVLMQEKEGKVHPVAYFSKRTTIAESKYHSYELETLAVVNAVKHFRHYLHGRKFIVVTDCSSLRSTRKKLDLTPRVHRWWAFLQGFDFDIVHRSGKRMPHVDFFSRNPIPTDGTKVSSVVTVPSKQVNLTELPENWLLAEQQKDNELSKLMTDLKEGNLGPDVAKTYEFRSGVLHRKIQRRGKTRCLPIVPRSFRWSVINVIHEGLFHLGWEKTLEKVYDMYWFENMTRYVRKFVENCITCKISKSHSGKVQAELHPIPKVAIPWHTVHVDVTGKLSGKNDRKEYVFVLIDAFTKYVLLYHTLNIDTVSSIKAIKASVSLFGAPVRLIVDQGRCFASKEFKNYCDSVNIKLHLIASGSSRANGQVERIMSTLKNMLTAVETGNRSWQDALPDVQLAINCTTNRVTKASSLELLIGRVARPLDILLATDEEQVIDLDQVRTEAVENMEKGAAYDKARFDSTKAKITPFAIGDFVLLRNEERNQTKLDPKYRGPFRVIEVLEGNRYTLKALNSKRTYKYAHDRLKKMPDNDDTISKDLDNVDLTDSDSNTDTANEGVGPSTSFS